MKIKTLEVLNVGGVDSINLSFNSRVNILCGPNGIGKTTVLESIAHVFSAGSTDILKRNAKSDSGFVNATLAHGEVDRLVKLQLSEFVPSRKNSMNGAAEHSDYLLSLKINRTFNYRPLDAVRKDAEKPSHVTFEEARLGVKFDDVKDWFVNRYLYSLHGLSKSQLSNFTLAKESFSALDEAYSFSRVDPSTNEIMINSPGGEIYYEYLSSGFKSCLSIIFGIIKEVEYRFTKNNVEAKDFAGVVLIDEIELHLHPEWQSRIMDVLTETFPEVQFICSTHSPHVIQSASSSQIIAIEAIGGKVRRRVMPENESGFKGWTIEEVLADVMGMKALRTSDYEKVRSKFESCLDNEDREGAEASFLELDQMLHPASHLRKIFSMQVASIPSDVHD